ncbi:MAG: HDOD domain-containing protein [Armatimonadota bacterium]|nr:HDOD domain-containing protein [Armatimonadota bacterium]
MPRRPLKVFNLPNMPAALLRVVHIANDESATAEELADAIMLDPSLATRILRIANSAYFGRLKKVDTITEAVVALGFNCIRNLATTAYIIDAVFPEERFPTFSWRHLWVHSVACATCTELIYTAITLYPYTSDECAFLAGLLHDVGKMVIALAAPHKFNEILEVCPDYGFDMFNAEYSILRTDHAEVGELLTAEWGLPPTISKAIGWHHTPKAAKEFQDLARAVSAGNLLAKRLTKSPFVGHVPSVSVQDVAEISRLSISKIHHITNLVRAKMQTLTDIISWAEVRL